MTIVREGRAAWTGGQYSLFRASFGAYLCVHFAMLVPWGAEVWSSEGVLARGEASPLLLPIHIFYWLDAPWFVTGTLIAAAALSVLLALGWRDRIAAVILWWVWASLHARNPLISNPGLPYVGWMLLAHAAMPAAPFGSLSALGRVDPKGDWRFPGFLWASAWLLMAVGYSYSGATKLVSPSWVDGSAIARVMASPLARDVPWRLWLLDLPAPLLTAMTWGALGLELLFAPLAVFRAARPWLWLLLLGMHLQLMTLIDFADLSLGMVMLHLFTFNPGWVKPLATGGPETLFYDGGCGLCHRAVRFVLAEDFRDDAFIFAPLHGETFERMIPVERRAELPDSIVLVTEDGRLLTRSTAVIHILRRLGGLWRVLGEVGRLVPAAVRDAAYDFIARIRSRIFAKPADVCPLLPPALRSRMAP